MHGFSSRSVLIITIAAACVIFAIELWRQGFTPWLALWLLPIVLLCCATWLLGREVQARRTTEAALRRSEERFTKIFAYSPAGIALSRRADGCYLEVNDTYARLTGYSRNELIGRTSIDLGLFSAAARTALLDTLQAQGSARGIDLQITTKFGASLDVYCGIELVEFNGEPCLLSSVIDITDRKQVEQKLRRLNDELEDRVTHRTAALEAALADQQAALKLKDEFLAMISHELRTPLNGVLTMAEILEGEVSGPLNQRQRLYVGNILASGARLLEVVNSILSYTQLISGGLQLTYEHCRLAYLLEIATASLRLKATAKQQTFTVDVSPPDLAITTDPEALVQVIKRLLDNAVKFTPAGGQVGVYTKLGIVPGTVKVVVWDTGIGLEGTELADLVQPLKQGDGSLARAHEGVGMGLAYVNRMVVLLGGHLDLEPHQPTGSCFIVTLPL
jgi:two-component system, sensor histidine kinase and response regulator